MAPAICLVMAATGVKATATASIFDKFFETYWDEQGPEDGNIDIVMDEEVPL